jgi:hypothetical protein
VRTRIAVALACVVPVLAIPPAVAADGLGTVSGLVTVPRPGGYYGTITLYPQDGGETVTLTTTDGGHYLATVPIGTYKVGFSVEATDDFGTTYYDGAASLGTATPILVEDDTPTEDIDADLEIDPTKGEATGHIATAGGELYSGDVTFYRVVGDTRTVAGSAYAYLGEYTKVLAPGTYTFGFGLDPDDAYLPRYYSSSTTLMGADTFGISAGSDVTADAVATTDPGQGVISGTVTTPDGPFTGDATFVWQGAGPADHPTLTSYVGGGTYSRTLRPGTYLVGFSLTGDDGYLAQYFDGKPTPAGATLVTVGAGEEVPSVDAVLEVDLGVGHVAGTVTAPGDGFDGSVSFFRQDGDGDAVADYAASATDGEYDRALPPGDYKVGFGVSGTDEYLPAYYDGADSLATATVVAITAGETTDDIDGTLVLAPTEPAAPPAPTVARGDRRATVSWTAPDDDGGSPVTAYVVSSGSLHRTLPASARKATITGLTNGTRYRFTVVAVNDVGDSPASAPSAAVVPAGVPGRVGRPTAQVRGRTVTLTWPAADANGARVTRYSVTWRREDLVVTTTTTKRQLALRRLTPGRYRFVVSARNAVGSSTASPAVTVKVKTGR